MLSSKAGLLFALLFVVTASARPAEKRWGGWSGSSSSGSNKWWQPSRTSGSGFLDLGKRFGDDIAGQCNLANAVSAMNLAAASSPSPLPGPDPSLSLFQVAIGRGTQNYTCDLSNATATPVPIGALATLFNVSCIAADMPELLSALPSIALDLPVPTSDDENSPIMQDMSGHHYFVDNTTAFFNLDTPLHQYGMGAVGKANASYAPSNAVVGQNGQGYGAVQWLKLNVKTYAEDSWQEVYRLNTAGGNPPKSCTGQQATIEIPYAAEYWLFS